MRSFHQRLETSESFENIIYEQKLFDNFSSRVSETTFKFQDSLCGDTERTSYKVNMEQLRMFLLRKRSQDYQESMLSTS